MRTADIEVFSDFTCPWCYITKRRLEAAVRALPPDITTEIQWRPFASPAPNRDAAAEDFLTNIGVTEGIAFAFDRIPGEPNTLDAHRLVWLAQNDGQPPEYLATLVEGIYRAYFTEGRDIAALRTLAAIAIEAGLDPQRVESWLAGRSGEHEVRASQRAAAAMGIDTIPFLLVNSQVGIRGARSTAQLLEKIQGASWFGVDHRAARRHVRDRRKRTLAPTRERRAVEALIDDILSDTFPASDPPTWGAPARRLRGL